MIKNNKSVKEKQLFEDLYKNFVVIKQDDDSFIHMFGPVKFPVLLENSQRVVFDWYVWYSHERLMSFEELLKSLKKHGAKQNYNSIFTFGDFKNHDNPLVRIHSCCFTGDVFNSSKCDCGPQLQKSIQLIINNGSGAIIYLANHEGRGIGLFGKAIANKIQEHGYDTYEANNVINFEDDERTFEESINVLKYFRDNRGITLLSNNPDKIRNILESSIVLNQTDPLKGFENMDNIQYLRSKQKRTQLINFQEDKKNT
jgi:GTP cyclohydrolase II